MTSASGSSERHGNDRSNGPLEATSVIVVPLPAGSHILDAALAVAEQGDRVAGALRRGTGEYAGAFLWDRARGLRPIEDPDTGTLPGPIHAISGDGETVAVGVCGSTVVWRSGRIRMEVPGLENNAAMSTDGRCIVGGLDEPAGILRGRDGGPLEDLGVPGECCTFVLGTSDVSADGSTIIGFAEYGWVYRDGYGFDNLARLVGGPAWGTALSADGRRVLINTPDGDAVLDLSDGRRTRIGAAQWMRFATADLGLLASARSVWTAAAGEVDLARLLGGAPGLPDAYELGAIRGISGSGRVLAGAGRDRHGAPSLWVATLRGGPVRPG